MLKVFKLRRSGFNKSVSVGESFMYESDKYVIIAISELDVQVYRNPKLDMTAVCQKVNSDTDFSKYNRYSSFKRRYNTAKDMFPDIYKVGEFIGAQGEKDDLAIQITGINQMYYEHVDLIVEYNAQLIKPWSKAEID
ncbi:hypothetical protein ACSFB8_07515 [Enterococcus faecalis]